MRPNKRVHNLGLILGDRNYYRSTAIHWDMLTDKQNLGP